MSWLQHMLACPYLSSNFQTPIIFYLYVQKLWNLYSRKAYSEAHIYKKFQKILKINWDQVTLPKIDLSTIQTFSPFGVKLYIISEFWILDFSSINEASISTGITHFTTVVQFIYSGPCNRPLMVYKQFSGWKRAEFFFCMYGVTHVHAYLVSHILQFFTISEFHKMKSRLQGNKIGLGSQVYAGDSRHLYTVIWCTAVVVLKC
jgi:hypothetical protein